MQAEYTGVKIKLGNEEKIITPQQAEELRDALTQLLGPKSLANPYVQYMEQCRRAAQQAQSNYPSPQFQPYFTVAPQSTPPPVAVPNAAPFPGQMPTVYCGTTSVQAVC